MVKSVTCINFYDFPTNFKITGQKHIPHCVCTHGNCVLTRQTADLS